MPRAARVRKLQPDMPLSQAAAMILQVKLPEVLRYEAGTRLGQVEPVHDMRIGAKRLREAVRVLRPGIPRAGRKRLLPSVERLNDLLGMVRDRDVLQEAFAALTRQDSRTAGLNDLVKDLKRQRKYHHKALVSFLDGLHASDFEVFYERLMEQMLHEPAEGQPLLAAFAVQAVELRQGEVVDNMCAVHHPEEVSAFHRQRIRVKKLKYALEPFLTILPAEVKSLYEQIAVLQELMGLVHDVDVQTEVLSGWAHDHKRAEETGVATDLLSSRRQQLVHQTIEHAEAMEAAEFDEKLARILQSIVAA